MPYRTTLAAAILAAGSLPALAQGTGYAGSTLGLTGSGVPSNPFASNYPSAPPPRAVIARRERRAVRRPVREPGLLPPGRIPE
ncbi:hypothetical protein FV232_01650 [Methylobacterium sp. WL30]|uniref:hypothetical protein n=1 Tax=unclassified Methylobacterium TaxID=2615210 RepID=UPI0011CBB8A7|nr:MULTISPECIES: hypothetical protein [unclassified Methylobacterium]TXN41628.1 hypothetical protein FV225_01900 [Methylobacterium sp. WL93]TXN52851.1 hypothetical protein FV227_01395 [Methylobacterium sp. WL119]TXN70524.1 hypothetical protein FV232_01650 [Methylobacterium sp. WL30]